MDIIIFILVLGLIIFIHELGHFVFARRAKILCHEFALGMGPVIYQKRKGEIVYSIRAIPLGGYVSMAGEDMGTIINKEQRIGLNLDENGIVKELVLTNEVTHEIFGKVNDFDLVGQDYSQLYIEMLANGELIKYNVNRNAKYILSEKKEMYLAPAERSYENKTLWQRFLVVFAGPAANFILAFLLLFVLAFFVGKPVNKSIIGKVNTDESSYQNIKQGDVVSKVNGNEVETFEDLYKQIYLANDTKATFTINDEEHIVNLMVVIQGLGIRNQVGNDDLVLGEPFGREKNVKENDLLTGIYMSNDGDLKDIEYIQLTSWNQLIEYTEQNKELSQIYLRITRDGKELRVNYDNIPSSTLEKLGASYIGYVTGFEQLRKFNIFYPLYYPFKVIGSNMKEMINTIGLLFMPKTGVGVGDLSGPIGIFSMVQQARKNGIASFIQFVAFLSVNIGLLNLLPIPALDGGRLVFIGYEAITKKKVNKKVENNLILITFILLFALMIFVTFKDIIRLF